MTYFLIIIFAYCIIGLTVSIFGTIGLMMVENNLADINAEHEIFTGVTEDLIYTRWHRGGIFYRMICILVDALIWPLEVYLAIKLYKSR